ncbi:hypothetical protein HYPSUDRAFT_208688 [Hypholoma sublateritium FD-334 SS-4]|uniref:Uncharacterized protein n=1 Tax=Hypholoma sublateritium (strain FD-334 SS-4) TaxID=945553 RepID=A0A0D2KII7_HYPSF|nr:hypothetical protein HYPSUDRAFT_208688 [Hypholoma sublateritium FD-334 SS-4]
MGNTLRSGPAALAHARKERCNTVQQQQQQQQCDAPCAVHARHAPAHIPHLSPVRGPQTHPARDGDARARAAVVARSLVSCPSRLRGARVCFKLSYFQLALHPAPPSAPVGMRYVPHGAARGDLTTQDADHESGVRGVFRASAWRGVSGGIRGRAAGTRVRPPPPPSFRGPDPGRAALAAQAASLPHIPTSHWIFDSHAATAALSNLQDF